MRGNFTQEKDARKLTNTKQSQRKQHVWERLYFNPFQEEKGMSKCDLTSQYYDLLLL